MFNQFCSVEPRRSGPEKVEASMLRIKSEGGQRIPCAIQYQANVTFRQFVRLFWEIFQCL